MNLTDYDAKNEDINLMVEDKWILSKLNKVIKEATENMEHFELGIAVQKVQDFIWDEFCDWYIEMVKPRLYGKETEASRRTAQHVIATVLRDTMILLHPFMPFITEEIWQHLPHEGETIMLTQWPVANEDAISADTEAQMAVVMNVIRAIRNMRSEMNVPLGKKADCMIAANKEEFLSVVNEAAPYIMNLATLETLDVQMTLTEKPEQSVTAVVDGIEIFLPLKGLIDMDKEIARLEKEVEKVNKEIERLEKKLNNEGFVAKAPADVIAGEKEKLAKYQDSKAALVERLDSYRK
jgi:valyl-tRNA synthetase